jgi:hypothetical protein
MAQQIEITREFLTAVSDLQSAFYKVTHQKAGEFTLFDLMHPGWRTKEVVAAMEEISAAIEHLQKAMR